MSLLYSRKSIRRLGNLQIDWNLRVSYIRKGYAIGTYSICKDGKHCIYLDYDSFRIEWLLDELRGIRNKYMLSDFYIFCSSDKKKYHAVCFDKVNAKLYNLIIEESNVDALFKYNHLFDYENSRVLRFSGKGEVPMPEFFGVLKSKYHKRIKSFAHINFYKSVFQINDKLINYSNHDSSEGLNIISYATRRV